MAGLLSNENNKYFLEHEPVLLRKIWRKIFKIEQQENELWQKRLQLYKEISLYSRIIKKERRPMMTEDDELFGSEQPLIERVGHTESFLIERVSHTEIFLNGLYGYDPGHDDPFQHGVKCREQMNKKKTLPLKTDDLMKFDCDNSE